MIEVREKQKMYKIEKVKKKAKNNVKIQKLLSIILIVITLILLVLNLVIMFTSNMFTSEVGNIFGYKSLLIVSNSMNPVIYKNDLILIDSVKEEEIEVGDIISYKINDEIITHRIIKIENEEFLTQGDNNSSQDNWSVKYEDVEGEYRFKIPMFGYLYDILKNPITLIICIILFGLNIIHIRKISIKKEHRKKERENWTENKNKR